MSLRTDLLPVADAVRAIREQGGGIDTIVHQVFVVTKTWGGGFAGSDAHGSDATSEFAIAPRYLLREVSDQEVNESGGRLLHGDISVGPITPTFTDENGAPGGYADADLAPVSTSQGVEIYYRVTGPMEGQYQLVSLQQDRSFHRVLYLRRRNTTP